MMALERGYSARAHSPAAGQVTHVAARVAALYDSAGLPGRSERTSADGGGNPRLGQQDDGYEEDDEARTGRTFSGQLPVPTSRDFNSYLDCKNPIAVPKLGKVPAIF